MDILPRYPQSDGESELFPKSNSIALWCCVVCISSCGSEPGAFGFQHAARAYVGTSIKLGLGIDFRPIQFGHWAYVAAFR